MNKFRNLFLCVISLAFFLLPFVQINTVSTVDDPMVECKCKNEKGDNIDSVKVTESACFTLDDQNPGILSDSCVPTPIVQSGVDDKFYEEGGMASLPDGKIGEQGSSNSNLLGSVQNIDKLNQLGSKDIPSLLGNIIAKAMGVMGSIALVMIVYGGFLTMTAAGNAENVKKGTNILIWSTLGLVVIFASYMIVDLVFEAFR